MKKFSEYLTEAVEQLDEISKEKLGKYVSRSASDIEHHAREAADFSGDYMEV